MIDVSQILKDISHELSGYSVSKEGLVLTEFHKTLKLIVSLGRPIFSIIKKKKRAAWTS
jgi:hypothetical protein